ncbi:MAG: thiamine pyrophosphate-dependent dehydrogenase E1 component subunit alpha [Thermodesulfobacteriota bacterium]|nr:thiamine pyrophosphate-dependent dehydrogenase E1 component subunit alpha [Thermodesulfobacteriota bacterium]
MEPILNGEIQCPVHLYTGQEAIATGVCAALKKTDYIFGTHRSHGHYLAKGGGIKELVSEIFRKETGSSKGRGGSMHIIDPAKGVMGSAPIVAGTISLAVGAALASKIRKDKRVTVSFFGDGASGEGVLYESLNFASLKKLQIIFVCENNFYSTHMPIRECRPRNNIFKIGKPFCIPSYRVDGNDVLKVYEVAKKAVELCRKDEGPAFIEFLTYRLRGHVGPDDNIQGAHTDIKPKEEIARWQKKDPINRFRKYLIDNKIFTKKDLKRIDQQVKGEVNKFHVFARTSPFPRKEDLKKYVFKE